VRRGDRATDGGRDAEAIACAMEAGWEAAMNTRHEDAAREAPIKQKTRTKTAAKLH